MHTVASSWHVRPTRKRVLGLLLFPPICLLILCHAGLSSWPKVSNLRGAKTGRGGTWHVPQAWIENDSSASRCNATQMFDIIDAAECALHLALVNNAFMDNSHIPLIAHQTSRSTYPKTWSSLTRKCVERWQAAATGCADSSTAEMAWFMWDDDGVLALVEKYETDLYPAFSVLPYPVEKADVFRIVVLKWFGGIYGDMDSKPLRHPSTWVQASDLDDWFDERGNKHAQHQPQQPSYVTPDSAPASYMSSTWIMSADRGVTKEAVNAVFGLEADNLPEPDDKYWRMGYTFPVQLTNWAMAMSPHHPVSNLFISELIARVRENIDILPTIDPLNITGPPALTRIIKDYADNTEPKFAWQSLSNHGSHIPGGRAKIIAGDVLVLPITGFSPDRGWFHSMGSQSKNHPSARLQHMAAGSWRRADLKVTYGKLCRTAFGLCRGWSKIPDL